MGRKCSMQKHSVDDWLHHVRKGTEGGLCVISYRHFVTSQRGRSWEVHAARDTLHQADVLQHVVRRVPT